MSWPCRFHETPPDNPQPGDMWFEPWMAENDHAAYYLSEQYLRDWAGKRPPIVVRLPSGRNWCVDGKPSSGGDGWTVTGFPPNITVSPSINHSGMYHGWLRDGVLSDDVEGRQFQKGDG